MVVNKEVRRMILTTRKRLSFVAPGSNLTCFSLGRGLGNLALDLLPEMEC